MILSISANSVIIEYSRIIKAFFACSDSHNVIQFVFYFPHINRANQLIFVFLTKLCILINQGVSLDEKILKR